MVTAAGYDCIDMRAVSNGEAATNKSTEDARIFTAEPDNTIRTFAACAMSTPGEWGAWTGEVAVLEGVAQTAQNAQNA